MKKLICLALSLLLLSFACVSCAEQTPGEGEDSSSPAPVSSEPAETESESLPESETETPETEEPDTSKYEYEYMPPEDGSFTICGVPLSEYTQVLYFPQTQDNSWMNHITYKNRLAETTASAIGSELEIKVARNEKMFTEKRYEHEILFGTGFVRDGIPEPDLSKTYYGVTADGTVYFCSPAVAVFPYLWELFLEEFFGVPVKSGQPSAGCAVPECYRELKPMDGASLESQGYTLVFEDNFEADELDLNVWRHRGLGREGGGFNAASSVSLADGFLTIRGDYRDGEYGEGWYAGQIALTQWYCRGYFEARIRCSTCLGRSKDMWSAFWIQGPGPYNAETSQGGIGPGGAEIDIMENFGTDHFTSCIHCAWGEGAGEVVSEVNVVTGLGNAYDEEFHTYALLWDETYYRIYLDGILVQCTDHKAGTSAVEEEVVLELVPGSTVPLDLSETREMVVDYLKIWQN